MSVERVHLREIDLTRHVRTPAGVDRYHKPIGSPLGGGGAASRVRSDVKKTAKKVEKVKFSAAEHGPRDTLAFRNDPAVVSLRSRAEALSKPSAASITKSLTDADAAEVRKGLLPGSVTSNLWQLDNKRLQAAMDSPNIDPARLKALKIEKAKRLAVAQNILGKKAEVKEAVAHAAPGKITQAVHAHAPAPIAKIYDKITDKGRKVKDADHAQSIVDAVWDWVFKTVLTTGAVVLAAHTGVNLIGG